MCGHPLEVTLKLNVSVLEISNLCQIQFRVRPSTSLFRSGCWNGVYHVSASVDRPKGKDSWRNFLPTSKKLRPRLFISSPQCYFSSVGSLHCSLRCVTYGKQWISQYTVCSQNMFWLTFHWSRLSLRLPAKIVAVHFGCLPVWIYGGVSLSKDWWLVWVALAYCWVFCPMISALHFVQVLILRLWNLSFRRLGKHVERERGRVSAKWFVWELYSSSVYNV